MDYRLNKEKIIADVLRPMRVTRSFRLWMVFLLTGLVISIFAFAYQWRVGLGVTGLRDMVSWGMYIGNFVFFVATSLVGMLITAVLGMVGMKWVKPLTRIAEIIAVAFALVAGLVIIVDMGRPDRLFNLFIYGRFQSPILWDVTVILSYTAISALLLYLPLIPDLKTCSERMEGIHPLQRWIYKLLSVRWIGTPEQTQIVHRSMRVLSILIIPAALAIHTVTSWLFAVTMRTGWNSTLFGPYFVSGAFVSGSAALIIAMYFFRENYKLRDYFTGMHFERMARLLVLVSLVYLYFNINEFLVPGYKLEHFDAIHLRALFTGHFAWMFWSAQLFGLLFPILLLLIPSFMKPLPVMVISVFVLAGAWLKRYIIVVPTMEHPFLPPQHLPAGYLVYTPTSTEIIITLGTIFLTLIIITVLAKFLPIIPIWETTQREGHEDLPDDKI